MNRLRRLLLELWAMVPTTAIVAFLGPFGTYLREDYLHRIGEWAMLLMGAYVLARPLLIFWRWLAAATNLPRRSVTLSGMLFSSLPIAAIWYASAPHGLQGLHGYAIVVPFALLCSLLVMVIAWWAERADAHLAARYASDDPIDAGGPAPLQARAAPAAVQDVDAGRPRLRSRLSASFTGPILALESEDHYVRVHGNGFSELILLRLRDAIAEMDDAPGAQVHRSWWVARDAIERIGDAGRARELHLPGGLRAPVARESVDRLIRSGFLPAGLSPRS